MNCHLLRVNGGVKNGEGPIVSCHWYAECCSNIIRTLVGFDQNPAVSLPPDLQGAYYSMSPSNYSCHETNINSQNTAIYTQNEANFV